MVKKNFKFNPRNKQLEAEIDTTQFELNQMINAFDIATLNSEVEFGMIDGIKDTYEDEAGINTGASTNEVFDGGNELYTNGGNDLILISQSFDADSEPLEARIVILEEDIDGVTLNTDLKAYVSRDGGTTFSEITLSESGAFQSGSSLRLFSGTVNITGQPSGTSMVYKIQTFNNKELNIHATGLTWN